MPNTYYLSNKEDWEIYLTNVNSYNEYITLYNDKRTRSDKAKNIIRILKEHNVSNEEISNVIDKLNELVDDDVIQVRINNETNYIKKIL